MNFYIDTSTDSTIGVAVLQGRLDVTNRDALLKLFPEWLAQTTSIVFDCSGLNFLDSSGLGAFVTCLRQALDQHGDLRLAALASHVAMIFELTKAKRLFSIHQDLEDAIASFSS